MMDADDWEKLWNSRALVTGGFTVEQAFAFLGSNISDATAFSQYVSTGCWGDGLDARGDKDLLCAIFCALLKQLHTKLVADHAAGLSSKHYVYVLNKCRERSWQFGHSEISLATLVQAAVESFGEGTVAEGGFWSIVPLSADEPAPKLNRVAAVDLLDTFGVQ